MFGGGTRVVIDGEGGGKRWPVVAVEDSSAEEVDEPWPVGAVVVVCGDMEAEPSAAVGHVLLEGGALRWCLGEVIEPEDELILGESGGIEVIPVSCRGEFKVFALCCG